MLLLAVGLVLFLGIHLVPTSPDLRNGLVERFGANAYKAIFAVLSFAGLVLIIYGYHKLQVNPGKNVFFGDPPSWLKHVSWLLMLPAMIALVAAYVPSRIRSALKHPMLVAIKIWALAHLLVNWDLGSILLFGSFLAYAVYDRISVKKRGALGPLGAKRGGLAGDLTVLVIGVGLYAFMLKAGHAWLIGVPLLPA
ncbi:MAG: NnrU family protein [Hyphomicrobium sp. 32-62-53]|nr:MAG: NnrU family protein [Hyphomicrobium sp. 12-62-95]OYX99339.1 MAG: NnrU family protein [Hyphomicrobium sp. 32-62-53]